MRLKAWSFSAFPKSFQKETLGKVAELAKRGESVQLVAPAGAGNSILIKLITQVPTIRERYFTRAGFRFVLLDGNLLLERKALTLSRLFLASLVEAGEVPSDNLAINKKLKEKIGEMTKEKRVVAILDHLESVNHSELKPFFANLDALFQIFRPRLSFIFASERALVELADLENFGPLGKLVASNVIFMPPLKKSEAFWFMEEVSRQLEMALTKGQKEKIFELAGGFPRTIKRIVEVVDKGSTIKKIFDHPWSYSALSAHLEELSVSVETNKASPILKAFLYGKAKAGRGEVMEGIKLTKDLTKIEAKILKFLWQNKNKIVEREMAIEAVWGRQALGVSDHAYDQVVHRLREKLKGSVPEVVLETVRGRGHRLKIQLKEKLTTLAVLEVE